uniref:Putative polyprotein n=1 Tax=Albugo laibachii Nc14 TaxID=890382 RepID=F0WF97_9STRA|nr:putative polyprotein [Albugo laibachii Nc14]|eukprot:CCA19879.1 putative polyprotein [Albugo laibachii Nc14]
MCPNKSGFTDLQALKKKMPISVANGSKVDAVGVGNIFARLKNNRNMRIDDVLYGPGLDQKLLSVSALAEKGLQLVFRNLTCEIKSDDRSIVEIQRIGKLFVLECKTLEVAHFGGKAGQHEDVPVDDPVDESIWQASFDQISTKRMRNMKNYVVGLNIKTKSALVCEESEICEGCMNGKSSAQPFGSSAHGKVQTKALLEVVHSDVTGPMRVKSQGGAKYMVTFIEDFSRFIHAYFIRPWVKFSVNSPNSKHLSKISWEKGSNVCARTMVGNTSTTNLRFYAKISESHIKPRLHIHQNRTYL